jgi:hypothetical protein
MAEIFNNGLLAMLVQPSHAMVQLVLSQDWTIKIYIFWNQRFHFRQKICSYIFNSRALYIILKLQIVMQGDRESSKGGKPFANHCMKELVLILF